MTRCDPWSRDIVPAERGGEVREVDVRPTSVDVQVDVTPTSVDVRPPEVDVRRVSVDVIPTPEMLTAGGRAFAEGGGVDVIWREMLLKPTPFNRTE